MAEGKWINEVTDQTPVADAARWVLSLRLEVVRNHLLPSLREPGKDIEHVHQLRVGTRRAGAAVEIFSICLPDKAYRQVRKHLRRLRRAAGDARDWDVFLAALTSDKHAAESASRAGLDLLAGYAVAQRIAAQARLEEACPGYPLEFEKLRTEVVSAVRSPRSGAGPRTLLDLARPMLSSLLHELNAAVAQDMENYENLHQVRIVGKRLRYAMEVFANCFAPPFRDELYPLVEQVQEILGHANDSFVALQRLGQLRDEVRANRLLERKRFEPGLLQLLRFHKQRLPQERQRFQEWWRHWQQVGGEAAFAGLLKPSVPQRTPPGGGTGGGLAPGGNGAGSEGMTGTAEPDGATPTTGAGPVGATTPP